MNEIAYKAAFDHWMHRTAMTASKNCFGGGLYTGKDGARRLARECGYALPDFGEYGDKNAGATYSGICVIAYQLRPPLDAKEWLEIVRGASAAEKELRRAMR